MPSKAIRNIASATSGASSPPPGRYHSVTELSIPNSSRVARRGSRDPSYNEAEVSEAMKSPKIQIKISLGLGNGRDRVLTCDLTKEYVAINGDYRS